MQRSVCKNRRLESSSIPHRQSKNRYRRSIVCAVAHLPHWRAQKNRPSLILLLRSASNTIWRESEPFDHRLATSGCIALQVHCLSRSSRSNSRRWLISVCFEGLSFERERLYHGGAHEPNVCWLLSPHETHHQWLRPRQAGIPPTPVLSMAPVLEMHTATGTSAPLLVPRRVGLVPRQFG